MNYYLNNNPLAEYAKKHPGCTLQEYLDKEQLNQQKLKDEESKRCKLEREYHESLSGKYFKLNFNGNNIIYFHLVNSNNTKVKVYTTYSDRTRPFSMYIEIERTINPLWLPNPYKQSKYWDKTSSLAEEISESEFLRITKLFEEFQNIFNQIKNPNDINN